MITKNMHQLLEIIEAEVRARPSAIEFEMAYQARVVVDRIKFAIRQLEQFIKPCAETREAGLQLLDALERLQALDRRFQARSGIAELTRNGTDTEATASSTITASQRN
jgi:hypothetical protein